MITLIVKSYFAILLSVGLGALCIFIAGAYVIAKLIFTSREEAIPTIEAQAHCTSFSNSQLESSLATPSSQLSETAPTESFDMSELNTISGNDVLFTQLDLARAYYELDKKSQAKKILATVIKQGSKVQQKEAQRLLDLM